MSHLQHFAGMSGGHVGTVVPATQKQGEKSREVEEFWRAVQKSDIISQRIFHITREEVEDEVKDDEDHELLQQALESISQEMGKADWIPKDSKTDVKLNGSDNIIFLSKLPDGVFVSGATSRALGRLRADFVFLLVRFIYHNHYTALCVK